MRGNQPKFLDAENKRYKFAEASELSQYFILNGPCGFPEFMSQFFNQYLIGKYVRNIEELKSKNQKLSSDWDWEWMDKGIGNGIGKWEIESTPSPRR